MMNSEKTYWARIYMAGDIDHARRVCRRFCMVVGACVTVEPATYIYTGGEESGFVIGFINYPRFPASPESISNRAFDLARMLRDELCQHSYSIMTPDMTTWVSSREENAP